jgi:hypothetical protein
MQVLRSTSTSVVNSDKSFPTPKFQTRKFSITWKGFEQQVDSLQSRQDPNAPTTRWRNSYVSNRPHNDITNLSNILCDVNSCWRSWTAARKLEKLIYRKENWLEDQIYRKESFCVDIKTNITWKNNNVATHARTHTHIFVDKTLCVVKKILYTFPNYSPH